MKDALVKAIADIHEDQAIQIAQEMLDANEDPQEILSACREAMAIVGERYETK
jgi:methanogenic corrinoid protein MtbC1